MVGAVKCGLGGSAYLCRLGGWVFTGRGFSTIMWRSSCTEGSDDYTTMNTGVDYYNNHSEGYPGNGVLHTSAWHSALTGKSAAKTMENAPDWQADWNLLSRQPFLSKEVKDFQQEMKDEVTAKINGAKKHLVKQQHKQLVRKEHGEIDQNPHVDFNHFKKQRDSPASCYDNNCDEELLLHTSLSIVGLKNATMRLFMSPPKFSTAEEAVKRKAEWMNDKKLLEGTYEQYKTISVRQRVKDMIKRLQNIFIRAADTWMEKNRPRMPQTAPPAAVPSNVQPRP